MRNTQVAVYGRVKPCQQGLLSEEFDLRFGKTEDQIIFSSFDKSSPKRKLFRLKKVFDGNATQEQIFDTVAKPIINDFLSGYNALIFTYGQTGTGKTYTMTGDLSDAKNQGLILRSINEIFQAKKDPVAKVTYCEIHNERVRDLIGDVDPDPEGTRVNQFKNSKITMFRDLSVHRVETASNAIELLSKGNEKKATVETEDGYTTSRSHVIFSIRLELPCTEDGILHLNPILYFVDFASMENREGSSGSLDARNMNLSLLCLEHVLLTLRQPRKGCLPYRNSRMTGFLKATLGGNSITAVIATFSLSVNDIEQTIQTCQFAERLGQITSIAYPNEIIIPSRKIFNPAKDIELLEKQYKFLKAHLGIFINNQHGDLQTKTNMRVKQPPGQDGLIRKTKDLMFNSKHVSYEENQKDMVEEIMLPDEELDEEEKNNCAALVEKFIAGDDVVDFLDCDIRKTIFCFHLMREVILKKEALLDTPVELHLSDLSFTSNNDPLTEASKASECKFTEKNMERKSFMELMNMNAQKEKSARGNTISPSVNAKTDENNTIELKLPEAVAKTSDSWFQKCNEEYVLVQKKIADRSELVLCMVKSGGKDILLSQSKSTVLFEM